MFNSPLRNKKGAVCVTTHNVRFVIKFKNLWLDTFTLCYALCNRILLDKWPYNKFKLVHQFTTCLYIRLYLQQCYSPYLKNDVNPWQRNSNLPIIKQNIFTQNKTLVNTKGEHNSHCLWTIHNPHRLKRRFLPRKCDSLGSYIVFHTIIPTKTCLHNNVIV